MSRITKSNQSSFRSLYLVGAIVIGLALFKPPVAKAHFQLIHLAESALTTEHPTRHVLTLFFTHPFEAGHTMGMGMDADGKTHPPKAFFVKHKDKVTNLLETLKPITFTSLTNSGSAYQTQYRFKGLGDFLFVVDPGPYYEESEDIYIQQVTKVIANRGGAADGWDQVLGPEHGLEVEIRPLVKPYAMWTGNVFRGVVLAKGASGKMEPVPYAEIEVEFLNHAILGTQFEKKAEVEAPQDAFVAQTILANKDGGFSYGVPRAGWWGFAALGAGGERTYKGKELSMDAVIWIQAKDMK